MERTLISFALACTLLFLVRTGIRELSVMMFALDGEGVMEKWMSIVREVA